MQCVKARGAPEPQFFRVAGGYNKKSMTGTLLFSERQNTKRFCV
jgi:hypothetical protein